MAAVNRVTACAASSAEFCCFSHLHVDFLVCQIFASSVGLVPTLEVLYARPFLHFPIFSRAF